MDKYSINKSPLLQHDDYDLDDYPQDSYTKHFSKADKAYPSILCCGLTYFLAILLIGLCTVGVYFSYRYNLPEATSGSIGLTLADQFSEVNAYDHLRALVQIATARNGTLDENGNYQVVGRIAMTASAQDTVNYLTSTVAAVIANATNQTVFNYYFTNSENLMEPEPEDSFVKMYENLTNFVVTMSGKDPNVKYPALLIGSHYDSVVYSPGASDNAVSLATCLEILRVFSQNEPFDYPVIFLFDDAEEGGLMGAHSFVTQDPLSGTVGVQINLDSGGGWGRALLGQLGPRNSWLASAYRKSALFPFASVVLQDVFGLSASGTNFEIFNKYGIPGPDTVFLLGGYAYHTELDSLFDYEEGTLQAHGENTISYIEQILRSSPEFLVARNESSGSAMTTTFYDIMGLIALAYDRDVAIIIASTETFLGLLIPILASAYFAKRLYHSYAKMFRLWLLFLVALLFYVLSLGVGVMFAVLAGALTELINPSFWFSHIMLGVFVFGFFQFLGMAFTQTLGYLAVSKLKRFLEQDDEDFGPPIEGEANFLPFVELNTLFAVNIVNVFFMDLLTSLDYGSAYLPFWWAVCFNAVAIIGFIIAVCVSKFFTDARVYNILSAFFYLLWSLIPLLVCIDVAVKMTLANTPQYGRLGVDNDSLYLGISFAAINSILLFFIIVPFTPLIHRAGHHWKMLFIVTLVTALLFLLGCFAFEPFTDLTPRRVDVIHYYAQEGPNGPATSKIMLGAPNAGPLTDITFEMEEFNTWEPCDCLSYGFKYQPGFCLADRVDAPSVPMPSIVLSNIDYDTESGIMGVDVTLNTPSSSFYYLTFNGTLNAWSLSDTVPKKGFDESGSYYVSDGYGIARRTGNPTFNFHLDFLGGSPVEFTLYTNYFVLSPVQWQVIQDLPSWTQLWGKSNNPGPIVVVTSFLLTSP